MLGSVATQLSVVLEMADSRASAAAGSNSNPFRRKPTSSHSAASSAAVTIDPGLEPSAHAIDLPAQQPTTSELFRQQLQALPQTNEPPPSTTFQKPKIVKKVRVQSPPPSSPESMGAPHTYPAYGYPDESSESSSDDDREYIEGPFRAEPPPLGVIGHANYSAPAAAPAMSGRPPPNPFKKTLEDIEHGSTEGPQSPGASAGGKIPLDVDAFKRLLMTGQVNASGAVQSAAVSSPGTLNPPSQATDAASITDASSVSRQSIFDAVIAQETPRTSHEISEAEGDEDRLRLIQNMQAKTQQTTPAPRKKPPPPSSRHGKLIKVDPSKKENDSSAGQDGVIQSSSPSSQAVVPGSPGSTSSSRRRPSNPSDVNKPLPPAPTRHSVDESSESIFDREAAGKVPEPEDTDLDADAVPTPRPPTPPNASHAIAADTSHAAATNATPPDSRKPPPPPRRNTHSRTENKLSAATKASTPADAPSAEEASSMRRSSQDSTRSRSSSLRINLHAPAPPPPRRPKHVSRPSLTSSSAASFMGLTPTTASSASSPAPSGGEQLSLHSPVPLVGSPETVTESPGPVSLDPTGAAASSQSMSKTKLSRPPLPPARNASVRASTGRPASQTSVDAPSRRAKEKEGSVSGAPPPPPPPKRSRAGSGRDRGALVDGTVVEEPEPTSTESGSGNGRRSEDKSADDILADLSELQREVDALRGKYDKKPGPV